MSLCTSLAYLRLWTGCCLLSSTYLSTVRTSSTDHDVSVAAPPARVPEDRRGQVFAHQFSSPVSVFCDTRVVGEPMAVYQCLLFTLYFLRIVSSFVVEALERSHNYKQTTTKTHSFHPHMARIFLKNKIIMDPYALMVLQWLATAPTLYSRCKSTNQCSAIDRLIFFTFAKKSDDDKDLERILSISEMILSHNCQALLHISLL